MTDTIRLAEIGERCERATERPWEARKHSCSGYYEIKAEGGADTVVLHANWEDSGVVCEEDADFIAHAREDVPWLLAQLEQLACADASWQATESRLVHICQLLCVDYTCEEPETCEQVIERMKADIKESKGKLDIIVREGAGEPPDSLAADYGGTGWEKSKEVIAVRMERGKAAKAIHTEIERIKKDAGQLAAMRHVVEQQTEFLRFGCDIQPSESSAQVKVFIGMGRSVLASDAGKPEADVIAAAKRYEEADQQFMELDRNNPWFGHYREIVIDERIKAMKDICEAVVHLRDGSGGAVAVLEKGGEE